MSIWNYVFDNEWRQRSDIEALRNRASRTRTRMRSSRSQQDARVDQLEDEVGELALLSRALLTILREQGVVDPARLAEVMHDIDAEDGVVDGKTTLSTPRPASDSAPEGTSPAPKRRRRR